MTLKNKVVLVTGGAGFIGSHLVDRIFEENPARVIVVDNFFLGSEQNLDQAKSRFGDLRVYRLDASDLAAMKHLVEKEKIEVAFNLAVIPLPTSLEFPLWTTKTNIDIALTLCELIRWEGIGTLVHCSSSEVYGTGQVFPMAEDQPLLASTPYAASKAAADQIVFSYQRTFNIDTVIVRPFNNYGPRQNDQAYAGIIPIIIKKIASDEPITITGDGTQTRDYIYVKETADAMVRIFDQGETRGKVMNVASGYEISVNDLVSLFTKAMGKPDHPVNHVDARAGDVLRHCGDISLARNLIGFKPKIFAPEDVKETIDWYLKKNRRV